MSNGHVISRTLPTVLGRPRVPDVAEEHQVHVSTYTRRWLTIDTFEDLLTHERDIVERISATVNGGNLFMANPFMLLADIGVEISEPVRQQILRHESTLSAVSATAYNAIKENRGKQNPNIHIHGLFPRRAL